MGLPGYLTRTPGSTRVDDDVTTAVRQAHPLRVARVQVPSPGLDPKDREGKSTGLGRFRNRKGIRDWYKYYQGD